MWSQFPAPAEPTLDGKHVNESLDDTDTDTADIVPYLPGSVSNINRKHNMTVSTLYSDTFPLMWTTLIRLKLYFEGTEDQCSIQLHTYRTKPLSNQATVWDLDSTLVVAPSLAA